MIVATRVVRQGRTMVRLTVDGMPLGLAATLDEVAQLLKPLGLSIAGVTGDLACLVPVPRETATRQHVTG